MARDPRDKVVLITGASAGIGAAVAREAARRGYHLALTARRADRLEVLAGELRASAARVETIPADLVDPASPPRIVAETVARLGGIDVLVNNAGFALPGRFGHSNPDALRRQLTVNFEAPLLLARHALPHLIDRRGTIINIGSSITSLANAALGAYGATKAGLAYWNDGLRRELRGRGVKVCLVEPGPVKSEFMEAVSKLAAPEERLDPIVTIPQPWMTASVEEVAWRIVRLIDHPRRRLSVRRRVVWPLRVIGGLFQVWPALGDWTLSRIADQLDRRGDLSRTPRRADDVPPS